MGGPGVLPSLIGQKEGNSGVVVEARIRAMAGISVETGEAELSHTTAHMVRECHIQLPHHRYMAYGQKGENGQKWGA